MSGAATAPRTGWATGADAALRASGIALAALAWEAFARARPSTFFPPLSRTLATLGRMALDGSLPSHLLVSSFRGIAGFALAIALGVPLGLLLGHGAPRAHAVLEPALRVASQVNPFALLSVFLLVFGGG